MRVEFEMSTLSSSINDFFSNLVRFSPSAELITFTGIFYARTKINHCSNECHKVNYYILI